MNIIWTQALADAAAALAADNGQYRTITNTADIRSRAREFSHLRVNSSMTANHVAYFQLLRSRIDYAIPTHRMLEEAWNSAYHRAHLRAQAPFMNVGYAIELEIDYQLERARNGDSSYTRADYMYECNTP